MERRFQYYVPFTNHTHYRARAREHNNTLEKFTLNFTHPFHVHEHYSYVCTHIYIGAMHTKTALSAWISLVSIFCSSGAVSGIRGKQITPAVAHDYNSYIKSPCLGAHVRTYISGYRCTWRQKTTNRHVHTHTRGHSDDNNEKY